MDALRPPDGTPPSVRSTRRCARRNLPAHGTSSCPLYIIGICCVVLYHHFRLIPRTDTTVALRRGKAGGPGVASDRGRPGTVDARERGPNDAVWLWAWLWVPREPCPVGLSGECAPPSESTVRAPVTAAVPPPRSGVWTAPPANRSVECCPQGRKAQLCSMGSLTHFPPARWIAAWRQSVLGGPAYPLRAHLLRTTCLPRMHG
jgi:hypothetical protein